MRRRRTILEIVFMALIGIGLTACSVVGGENSPAPPAQTDQPIVETISNLEGVTWRLVTYRDGKGNTMAVLPGSEITALFQAGKLNGNAGCNSYFADYTVEGDRLTIGEVGSTMMYCNDFMDQESDYLAAIRQVATFKIADNRLQLVDESGQTILIYTVLPES